VEQGVNVSKDVVQPTLTAVMSHYALHLPQPQMHVEIELNNNISASQLNDILLGAFKRAQVPAVKEPPGLSRDDSKRPDSVMLLSWAKGKPLAWDVTVPDTYADSHLADTATTAGAAADNAASNKEGKYSHLANSHILLKLP